MSEIVLKIAAAQLNPVVGDIYGNASLIAKAWQEAKADLVVTPELALSGYPPEDLVLRPGFLRRIEAEIERLCTLTRGKPGGVLVGTPWIVEGKLYNAALLIEEGKIRHKVLKTHLPTYGVFDETRIFSVSPSFPDAIDFHGVRLGVMICEDMWFPESARHLQNQGAEILIVPNGSPYEEGKRAIRVHHATQRVAETKLPLLYVNQVGGQDEIVFDGHSFLMDSDGQVTRFAPGFEPSLTILDLHKKNGACRFTGVAQTKEVDGIEEIYRALTLGLADYVNKTGFPGVLLGLSGGIDSALAAAIAVDALGADRVRAVMMPSPYTSPESLEDAAACAKSLGIKLDTIAIDLAMTAFSDMLAPSFRDRPADTTEENIQSRARGVTLMALSNKTGWMVLSTGNKSEMAVGYATLYGDMCGGFSVLKDVYKTQVYALSRWRNQQGHVIPERIITKAPSAELKPNQTDQDTLPPYDRLDAILKGLIEEQRDVADLVQQGFDATEITRIWRMLDRAEYKRRQAPPGVKITARSFGRERRYPIVNFYGPDES